MLVRKVFPELDEISDNSITFEATFGDGTPSWTKLMDEVWPQFVDNPPTRIKVKVADAPGDREKRKRASVSVLLYADSRQETSGAWQLPASSCASRLWSWRLSSDSSTSVISIKRRCQAGVIVFFVG